MAKRLVVCCDGTWNTADQPHATNVTKFALAAVHGEVDGVEQRVFYDAGVGTTRTERIRGGVFGFGLSTNVKEAYRFLVEEFTPGDELFFVGFSRGAFTARSVAGLVRNAGILRPGHADRVDDAYALYRNRDKATEPRQREAILFRRSYSHETRIKFIGVWDTVGTLGIPVSGLRSAKAINQRWAFHDTELSSHVDNAFHAVAIDEVRRPFTPTLWKQQPEAVAEQRVEQVWFTGVHCDVGGGYPDAALADITLRWMIGRARECGLGFDDHLVREVAPDPDPMGPLHDSRARLFKLLRPAPRTIGEREDGKPVFANESVSSTAVMRREKDPSRYAPQQLVDYLNGPDPHTTEIELG